MSTSMYREVMDQKHTLASVAAQFAPCVERVWTSIRGKPLFLIGTGASYNACKAARDAFILHASVFPHMLYAADALNYPARCFDGAAVLLASQSGESHETKLLCQRLRQAGATLIAVTMNPQSTLARAADALMCADIGPEISSATKTYTAQTLMLCMLAAHGEKELFHGLQEDMKASLDAMDAAADRAARLLAQSRAGYIAGVGMLEPAASQAALMLKEKCFLCYEGMSVNELRHGTVETVEPGMSIVLLATGEDGLREAEIHAAFLRDIGANVFLVYDAGDTAVLPEESKVKLRCRVRPELANIIFAVFGQLTAERIASEAGYDVDGFRYLSKIVGHY